MGGSYFWGGVLLSWKGFAENYQLARHVLENGLAALQVNLDEIQVELFASRQQHIMQLYCARPLNNAFRFFWKAMGLAYANPP